MSRKKRDEVLGHADEADGIEEYDNPLPDWWVGLFLFTIVWAIGYTLDYHFLSDRSQEGSYLAEMSEAARRWPASAHAAVPVAVDDAAIAAGAKVYATNCAACHGGDLKGGIGPDLTDDVWIHGGSPEEIAKIITDGVPEKGMLTWGPILGPEKIAQVTAFVISKISSDGGATVD